MIDKIQQWNTQISNEIEDFKQGMKDIGNVAKDIWKVYEFTYNHSIGIYINKKLQEHYNLKEHRDKLNKFMYHRMNETLYIQRQLLDKNAKRPNFKLEESQDVYNELKDNQKILNKLHKNTYRTNSFDKYMDDNYMSYLKSEKLLDSAKKFQKDRLSKNLSSPMENLQAQHEKQKLVREYKRKMKADTKNLDNAIKSPSHIVLTGGISLLYGLLKDVQAMYEHSMDFRAELKELKEMKVLKDSERFNKLSRFLDDTLTKEIKDLYKNGDEKVLKDIESNEPKDILKQENIKDVSKTRKIENLIVIQAIMTNKDFQTPRFFDVQNIDSFKTLENKNKQLDNKIIDISLLENKMKKEKQPILEYTPENVKDEQKKTMKNTMRKTR